MNRRSVAAGLVLALFTLLAGWRPAHHGEDGGDTCLVVSVENLARGQGNFFSYLQFSTTEYTFQNGDFLEYDVYMPSNNPLLKGGVDAGLKTRGLKPELAGRPWLRDVGLVDQNGIRLHGDGLLEPARDKWYRRRFDLTPVVGCSASRWWINFEGDAPGRYVQLLDNVRITRDGKTVLSLYADGPAPALVQDVLEGYSRSVLVTSAPRAEVTAGGALDRLLEKARRETEIRGEQAKFRTELDVARQLAGRLGDTALLAEIDAAARDEDAAAFETGRFEAYLESLHRARHRLGHAHPLMQKFTGHLVGHAHIDLQWLWSWEETVAQIVPQTFGQAIRFMQEYPEFTFSQSSACLYDVTERRHPELFAKIAEQVKSGRWELVGGRWCEGDNNMISPESTVRHFLYGQRYFQGKFGRMATVGWEPDTFGHAWTMPQVLRKAGIDSYYFCRAGKGVPLFWWEGPDGSRVLAFEEPATGGWYNDVVDDEKVRELAKFAEATGALDHLMVYGVGNHGGGPTREYIEAALAMRGRGLWPRIRFSTAGEFFRALHRQVEAGGVKPPTIRDELNPVFEGCYTTHSRIKKYNRDSEALLESAEVWATLAAVRGARRGAMAYEYPRGDLEALWRDVLWNHHHDTLPGSFVHASAEYSYGIYEALKKRGETLADSAQALLLSSMPFQTEGAIAVLNPLAWPRSGMVEARLDCSDAVGERAMSVRIFDGARELPVEPSMVRPNARGARVFRFVADDVPACGVKVFRTVVLLVADQPVAHAAAADGPGPRTPPRYEVLHEKPHGMSAWTIGELDSTDVLSEQDRRTDDWGCRARSLRFGSSRIDETVSRPVAPGLVEYRASVDWKEAGDAKNGGPLLKVALDTGLKSATAVYDIPFGDIERKADGHENVALKWCAVTGTDASGATRTVAVLNDCKHAYDVREGVIRLTLVRSSFDPDPRPDVGVHEIRFGVFSMDGPLDRAAVVRAACEFNKPLTAVPWKPGAARRTSSEGGGSPAAKPGMISMDVPASVGARIAPASAGSGGVSGESWSGLSVEPANVIVTALKMAEDGEDVIVRAYECAGKPAKAEFVLGFPAATAGEVDLLERPLAGGAAPELGEGRLRAEFKPYEIRTFRLRR